MMSRISINLKRAGDRRLHDDTTRSALESVRFEHRRRHEQSSFAQHQDHSFEMSLPEPLARLSTYQIPLPPKTSTTDNPAEYTSFSKAGQHDLIHKPPPPVVAPEIPHVHHDIV
jgi:hypothetical protein